MDKLNRVIIKLSGEALSGDSSAKDSGKGEAKAKTKVETFCETTIKTIAGQIGAVLAAKTQVALVVGGGNFWRGRAADPGMNRVKADQIGMLATVMNAIYLSDAFKRHGIPAEVMTPIPVGSFTTLFSKESALKSMSEGTVTINAAGLGHPFFSTDTVSALRGLELECDAVLYTKNGVGGVYDRCPELPGAKMYRHLSYETAIAKQLQFADATALQLLAQADTPAFVFGLNEPDGIVRAAQSAQGFGTWIRNGLEEAYYE